MPPSSVKEMKKKKKLHLLKNHIHVEKWLTESLTFLLQELWWLICFWKSVEINWFSLTWYIHPLSTKPLLCGGSLAKVFTCLNFHPQTFTILLKEKKKATLHNWHCSFPESFMNSLDTALLGWHFSQVTYVI